MIVKIYDADILRRSLTYDYLAAYICGSCFFYLESAFFALEQIGERIHRGLRYQGKVHSFAGSVSVRSRSPPILFAHCSRRLLTRMIRRATGLLTAFRILRTVSHAAHRSAPGPDRWIHACSNSRVRCRRSVPSSNDDPMMIHPHAPLTARSAVREHILKRYFRRGKGVSDHRRGDWEEPGGISCHLLGAEGNQSPFQCGHDPGMSPRAPAHFPRKSTKKSG